MEPCSETETEVVIATADPEGTGTRHSAWLDLLDRIEARHGHHSVRMRLLTWHRVAEMVTPVRSPHLVGDETCASAARESRQNRAAIDTRAAAARLSISQRGVERLVASGRLPSLQVRRRRLTPVQAISHLLAGDATLSRSKSLDQGRSVAEHDGRRIGRRAGTIQCPAACAH